MSKKSSPAFFGPDQMKDLVKTTGDKRFPGVFFSPSKGSLQGKPVTALINLIYSNDYPYCSEFPCLIELEISMQAADSEGQPTKEEDEALQHAENVLIEAFGKSGAAFHYIARQTWNGKRMIDFYTDKEDVARHVMDSCKKDKLLGRALAYKISRDPTWETYKAFTKHFVDE